MLKKILRGSCGGLLEVYRGWPLSLTVYISRPKRTLSETLGHKPYSINWEPDTDLEAGYLMTNSSHLQPHSVCFRTFLFSSVYCFPITALERDYIAGLLSAIVRGSLGTTALYDLILL